MDHPGHRSSPLLSTLGIVALAGVATPLACRDRDGGPPPIDDFADVIDVYSDLYAFYCECYGDLYYADGGTEECLMEAEIFSDSEEACLAEVFEADPMAFEVLKCEAELLRGYASCIRAKGCPPTFTCGDGTDVPEDFVCDGEADCDDGSDEQQMCPPPLTCDAGMEVEDYFICDGFADCGDGTDEADCPAPFTCGDGTEIPARWVCNGSEECMDGEDEQQDCPQTCETKWLDREDECGDLSQVVQEMMDDCYDRSCEDGTVIAGNQICDGVADCVGGEDESGCPDAGESGGSSGGGESGGSSSG